MDTPIEIQERGIPLDDGPFYYDSSSFFKRLPTEFMASGYSVPWSPGDLPQMIPVDLLQEKHVRRESTICRAEPGLAFVNVKVLHFSQAPSTAYAEILEEMGITEIPGVYYAPGRRAVHIFPHSNLEPTETQTQARVEAIAQDPKPGPGRPSSAPDIKAAIKSLADEGKYPPGEKRKDEIRVVRERVHQLFSGKHPGNRNLGDKVIARELVAFERGITKTGL